MIVQQMSGDVADWIREGHRADARLQTVDANDMYECFRNRNYNSRVYVAEHGRISSVDRVLVFNDAVVIETR